MVFTINDYDSEFKIVSLHGQFQFNEIWWEQIGPLPINSQYMLIKPEIGLKFALNCVRGKD